MRTITSHWEPRGKKNFRFGTILFVALTASETKLRFVHKTRQSSPQIPYQDWGKSSAMSFAIESATCYHTFADPSHASSSPFPTSVWLHISNCPTRSALSMVANHSLDFCYSTQRFWLMGLSTRDWFCHKRFSISHFSPAQFLCDLRLFGCIKPLTRCFTRGWNQGQQFITKCKALWKDAVTSIRAIDSPARIINVDVRRGRVTPRRCVSAQAISTRRFGVLTVGNFLINWNILKTQHSQLLVAKYFVHSQFVSLCWAMSDLVVVVSLRHAVLHCYNIDSHDLHQVRVAIHLSCCDIKLYLIYLLSEIPN